MSRRFRSDDVSWILREKQHHPHMKRKKEKKERDLTNTRYNLNGNQIW